MTIHEQNYVRYEGQLLEGRAPLTIAWTSFRVMLGFTRTKLILLVLWLMPLGSIFGVFLEYSVRNSQLGSLANAEGVAPGGEPVAFFIQLSLFSLAILFMASGCGVIADDLRYRTFQLYFSKPMTKFEYGLGKFLGLFLLGSTITLIPGALVSILRMAFYARTDFALEIAQQMGIGYVILTLATAISSSVVLGLSSLTSHTRYVVLAWLGVLLVPILLGLIVSIAAEGTDTANLWSMTGNVWLVSKSLLTDEELTIPTIVPITILLGIGGAGLGALARRVHKLEGVA